MTHTNFTPVTTCEVSKGSLYFYEVQKTPTEMETEMCSVQVKGLRKNEKVVIEFLSGLWKGQTMTCKIENRLFKKS